MALTSQKGPENVGKNSCIGSGISELFGKPCTSSMLNDNYFILNGTNSSAFSLTLLYF